jgi:hypothetical protein
MGFATTWIKGRTAPKSIDNSTTLHFLLITAQDPSSGKSVTYWSVLNTTELCTNTWGSDDLAQASGIKCP